MGMPIDALQELIVSLREKEKELNQKKSKLEKYKVEDANRDEIREKISIIEKDSEKLSQEVEEHKRLKAQWEEERNELDIKIIKLMSLRVDITDAENVFKNKEGQFKSELEKLNHRLTGLYDAREEERKKRETLVLDENNARAKAKSSFFFRKKYLSEADGIAAAIREIDQKLWKMDATEAELRSGIEELTKKYNEDRNSLFNQVRDFNAQKIELERKRNSKKIVIDEKTSQLEILEAKIEANKQEISTYNGIITKIDKYLKCKEEVEKAEEKINETKRQIEETKRQLEDNKEKKKQANKESKAKESKAKESCLTNIMEENSMVPIELDESEVKRNNEEEIEMKAEKEQHNQMEMETESFCHLDALELKTQMGQLWLHRAEMLAKEEEYKDFKFENSRLCILVNSPEYWDLLKGIKLSKASVNLDIQALKNNNEKMVLLSPSGRYKTLKDVLEKICSAFLSHGVNDFIIVGDSVDPYPWKHYAYWYIDGEKRESEFEDSNWIDCNACNIWQWICNRGDERAWRLIYSLREINNGFSLDSYRADESEVYIPTVINNKNVVEIAANCFAEKNMHKIVVSGTVRKIGTRAFKNCKKLQSIIFNDMRGKEMDFSVLVFEGCSSLEDIELPKIVRELRESALYGCPLKKVILPKKVEEPINPLMFSYRGQTTISDHITIYSPFNKITQDFFSKLNLGINAVYIYGDGSEDEYCYMRYGGNGKKRDNRIFTQSNSFKDDIIIPEQIDGSPVDTIYLQAATSDDYRHDEYDEHPKYLHVPKSVTQIEYKAMNLARAEIDPDNPKYSSSISGICTKNGKTLLFATADSETGTCVIDDNITQIDENAFCTIKHAKKIIIGSSVFDIEDGMLDELNNLECIEVSEDNSEYSSEEGCLLNKRKDTLIKVPNHISEKVFSVPETVTVISPNAFIHYIEIEKLILPKKMKKYDESIFQNCPYIKEISFGEGSDNISLFFKIENNDTLIKYNGKEKKVIVPEGIKYIVSNAFRDSEIEEVLLPESLLVIESESFSGCRDLTKINIPNSVYYIGRNAFFCCYKLEYLEFDVNTYYEQGWRTSYKLKLRGDLDPVNNKFPEKYIEHNKNIVVTFRNSDGTLKRLIDNIEKVTIAPQIPISEFKEEKQIYAARGYILAYKNGEINNSDTEEEYIEVIKKLFGKKKYREELLSVKDAGAIEFATHYKIIPLRLIDDYIDEASKNGYTESTAMLIDYKNSAFSEDELEKKQKKDIKKMERELEKAFNPPVPKPLTEKQLSEYFPIVYDNSNKAQIRRYKGKEIIVEFPAEIDGTVIYGLADCVQSPPTHYHSIEKVIIPEGYTYIGKRAFKDCISLKEIILPSTLRNIGEEAFMGCKSLKKVILPAKVDRAGSRAFRESGIEEIYIYNKSFYTDKSCFYGVKDYKIFAPEGSEFTKGKHGNVLPKES